MASVQPSSSTVWNNGETSTTLGELVITRDGQFLLLVITSRERATLCRVAQVAGHRYNLFKAESGRGRTRDEKGNEAPPSGLDYSEGMYFNNRASLVSSSSVWSEALKLECED